MPATLRCRTPVEVCIVTVDPGDTPNVSAAPSSSQAAGPAAALMPLTRLSQGGSCAPEPTKKSAPGYGPGGKRARISETARPTRLKSSVVATSRAARP